MFFGIGWEHEENSSFSTGELQKCIKCKENVHWFLNDKAKQYTFFFIPLFSYENEYTNVCSNCHHQIELDVDEFKFHKAIADVNLAFSESKISEAERNTKLAEIKGAQAEKLEASLIKSINDSKEWKSIVETKSNEELILVLTKSKDYEPSFVIAVKEEFEKRNLAISELFEVNLEIERKENFEEAKANDCLEKHWRYLIFAFPFLPKIFLWDLRNQGYNRKANEAEFYARCGYVFYVIILVILVIIGV
jgi:hypothetical protein